MALLTARASHFGHVTSPDCRRLYPLHSPGSPSLSACFNIKNRLSHSTSILRQSQIIATSCAAGAFGQGVAHSQCIEAWLMSVPGLKVVAPSTPADAYGLLKAALRANGPVVYIDHKRLFPIPGELPTTEFVTDFGQAMIRRSGSD